LLQTKLLTNCDQWQEGHAMIRGSCFLAWPVCFPRFVVGCGQVPYPRCAGQLRSPE